MIRNTLLALAATAALIGTTELGSNQAQANPYVRFGFYGGYGHRWYYRPIIVSPVVVAPVAPPAVVYNPGYVTAAYPRYEVLTRNSANGPWQMYATYPSYQAAQSVVPGLQSSGLWVMVQQH